MTPCRPNVYSSERARQHCFKSSLMLSARELCRLFNHRLQYGIEYCFLNVGESRFIKWATWWLLKHRPRSDALKDRTCKTHTACFKFSIFQLENRKLFQRCRHLKLNTVIVFQLNVTVGIHRFSCPFLPKFFLNLNLCVHLKSYLPWPGQILEYLFFQSQESTET